MKRAGFCVAILLGVSLCAPVFAQDEPDASHWGAKYEGMPGQPAHGAAFQHMPAYQPGSVDTSLPGQPGHPPPIEAPAGYQMPHVPAMAATVPAFTPAPVTQPVVAQSVVTSSSAPPPQPVAISNVQVFSPDNLLTAPPPANTVSQDQLMRPVGPDEFQRDATTSPPTNAMPLAPNQAPSHMTLATLPGFDIGGQYYYDHYTEADDPSVFEGGEMVGLTAAATGTFGDGYFTTFDARYAYGKVDYQGSGKLNGTTNQEWEGRLTFGKDFIFPHDSDFEAFPDMSLSPYAGVGYRYLYNDLRGITSTGAHGYRRENQIFYLPVGVKPRFPLNDFSRISSTFEVDPMLWGQQKSFLSDLHLGDPDVKNWQPFGIGLRADISYETPWFSIGPFINAWLLDKSQQQTFHSPGSLCGSTTCVGFEPQNYTIEAGIQAKVHFLGPLLRY